MTQKNSLITQPIDISSLGRRMLIGGTIALILIALFIFPVTAKPEWGSLWMVRPLIVVSLAGAAGGACNYFLVNWSNQNRLNKILAYVLSFIIFVFGLWIGTVLGLNGTLWN